MSVKFLQKVGRWVIRTARGHRFQMQSTSPGQPIDPRFPRVGTKKLGPRKGRCGCEWCTALGATPIRNEINFREQMKELKYETN